MKPTLVQILVVVANIQVRLLKTEVETTITCLQIVYIVLRCALTRCITSSDTEQLRGSSSARLQTKPGRDATMSNPQPACDIDPISSAWFND